MGIMWPFLLALNALQGLHSISFMRGHRENVSMLSDANGGQQWQCRYDAIKSDSGQKSPTDVEPPVAVNLYLDLQELPLIHQWRFYISLHCCNNHSWRCTCRNPWHYKTDTEFLHGSWRPLYLWHHIVTWCTLSPFKSSNMSYFAACFYPRGNYKHARSITPPNASPQQRSTQPAGSQHSVQRGNYTSITPDTSRLL